MKTRQEVDPDTAVTVRAESTEVCSDMTEAQLRRLALNSRSFADRCDKRHSDWAKDSRARAATYTAFADSVRKTATRS